MPPKRPTIFDVAKHAGVSTSTVSRTLNAHPAVDPETRSKVLGSVDALGFIPRSEAVSRARRSVGRIGVTAPFSAHTAYWRLMNGVIRGFDGEGFELSIFDQPSAMTAPSPALAALPLRDRVDGLIVMGIPLDDVLADRIAEVGLPTVLVESERPGFSTVVIDNELEGRVAAETLLARGLEQFLFVGHRQAAKDVVLGSGRREAGVRRAVASAGLGQDAVLTILVGDDFDEAVAAAADALAGFSGSPLGVVAHYDGLAAAVRRAALDLGRSVPDDVAIIGFDDSDLARVLDLTSLHVPFEEAGAAAAELLLARIGGSTGSPRRLVLTSALVRRGSA